MVTGIFIFTRDKSDVLKNTLKSFLRCNSKIYIVDDSFEKLNQEINQKLSKEFAVEYLGQIEQKDFISSKNLDSSKYNFFIRSLGFSKWNLGFSRNFALMIAKSKGIQKALFVDDDIVMKDHQITEVLFSLLDDHFFAGAHVTNLLDDSIIGHIATERGIPDEKLVSGGFMAFCPNKIQHYFINIYNEDWIWQYFHLRKNTYVLQESVVQNYVDPYINYEKKILFQEFGEIVIEGIMQSYLSSDDYYDDLTRVSFWEKIINQRKEYLKDLEPKCEGHSHQKIIQYVFDRHLKFSPIIYQKLFSEYFTNQRIFKSIFESL